MKLIGILGGTFDPIHNGHLSLAQELFKQLGLAEVRFIPCQVPVLDKIAQATPQQRLTMLKLATQDQVNFTVDERELNRVTPSYTVDTLLSLRQDLGNVSLGFIMGSDALLGIMRWHHWQELLQLAHLIIVPRPGYLLPEQGSIAELVIRHKISDVRLLQQKSAGYIFITHITPPNISSTVIRKQIAAGLLPVDALPEKVLLYIREQKIYTAVK